MKNPFKPFAGKKKSGSESSKQEADAQNQDDLATQISRSTSSLTGRILMAMPGMRDPRFSKAVILLCAHDEGGAMGLVINHTLPGIDLSELLEQLEVQDHKTVNDVPVMSGGPVETARGFILHGNDFKQEDTIKIDEKYSVTGTIDALKAVAGGKGPDKMLFILGYAGWDAGQLDEELQQNTWLVTEADEDIIFNATPEEKWHAAVKKIGFDPGMLSSTAGTA